MRPSDRSRDSQPRARLSVPKKALFSFLATALFFLVLELVLAASGVRPILYDEDPYVGFSSRIPLFVEQNRPDGQTQVYLLQNPIRTTISRAALPRPTGPIVPAFYPDQ